MLYAAEWPCCHDPLRFSLGSEDLSRPRDNPTLFGAANGLRLPHVPPGAPLTGRSARAIALVRRVVESVAA